MGESVRFICETQANPLIYKKKKIEGDLWGRSLGGTTHECLPRLTMCPLPVAPPRRSTHRGFEMLLGRGMIRKPLDPCDIPALVLTRLSFLSVLLRCIWRAPRLSSPSDVR